MKSIPTSERIYISESSTDNHGVGRGVFAKHSIKKDEVIEICPVLEILPDDLLTENASYLHEYLFFYGEKKKKVLLALGFGSLYNHSYRPNAVYSIKEKEKVFEVKAIRDIPKDTEITFNYKGDSSTDLPLWFEI